MKELRTIQFDPVRCRAELDEFSELLKSKSELSERNELQPFFKSRAQLTAFIGAIIPNIGPANQVAYEFSVFGDFGSDIVIGNRERSTFCAIELEDARPNSIFNRLETRSTTEWGRRLEHGFSQLVDWFYVFDDHKNSAGFARHFGYGHVQFFGLLLIGRSADLLAHDLNRLRWRSDRVSINAHRIYCKTYDELHEELISNWRWSP